MNRGAWWTVVHVIAESDTMEATKQQQKSMNSHGALQWLVISISVLCLVGQSVRLFVTP